MTALSGTSTACFTRAELSCTCCIQRFSNSTRTARILSQCALEVALIDRALCGSDNAMLWGGRERLAIASWLAGLMLFSNDQTSFNKLTLSSVSSVGRMSALKERRNSPERQPWAQCRRHQMAEERTRFAGEERVCW